MNRVKFLFMLILLLSIAAGGLAFKAYLKGGNLFCTSVLGGTCENLKFRPGFDCPEMYCTTNKADCPNVTATIRVCIDPR